MRDAAEWAEKQFGAARLGNVSRTRRLVLLAEEAARRPSGIVSEACTSSASREGAFRLLENESVRPSDVAAPVYASTIRECACEETVLVAIDGSSLTLSDDARAKDLGGIGAWNLGARGVQTMNALAVTRGGAPIGICGQRYWLRENRSQTTPKEGPSDRSESRYWLELVEEVQRSFADDAPRTRPWFQADRGADAWPLYALATTEFSRVELQALLALRQPKGIADAVIATLSLAQAVRWVADVGGYNGPWKGPPGPTVIGRGLYDVLVTARAFEYRDKTR